MWAIVEQKEVRIGGAKKVRFSAKGSLRPNCSGRLHKKALLRDKEWRHCSLGRSMSLTVVAQSVSGLRGPPVISTACDIDNLVTRAVGLQYFRCRLQYCNSKLELLQTGRNTHDGIQKRCLRRLERRRLHSIGKSLRLIGLKG